MTHLLDPASSLRVPGRLAADPTNLGIAYPHGGADLGLVRAIVFRPGFLSERLPFEEFGGKIGEVLHGGQTPRLGVVLVGFTDALTQRVFPETVVGGTQGKRGIRSTSATNAGRLGSAGGFKLLFSPRDTANHPALVLYNAVPLVEDVAEVALNTEENTGIAVVFEALRDATGRDWLLQRLQDIAL
jgi:hypothetical protein